MSRTIGRLVRNAGPSGLSRPDDERLETTWFESGVFSVRRTSLPPPPSSLASSAAPIGDDFADGWFR